ncbi:hypothetical protein KY347_00745 [Candidatus Woesearchaeota archaeon]|nr:hypothetical protein [Candidatus Woesearchaeota archaeon]
MKRKKQKSEEKTNWTQEVIAIVAIVTMIVTAIGYYNLIKLQTPRPELILHIPEQATYLCKGFALESYETPVKLLTPYGVSVKIANVGMRYAIDTKLIITYDEPDSFFDAFFAKERREVNKTNPNYPT